jgi:hypothetical protein
MGVESSRTCESCGMPIDVGRYCEHCTDEEGNLQAFEVRFEKMVGFTLSRDPGLDRKQAERLVREHMRRMPAWKGHPALAAR